MLPTVPTMMSLAQAVQKALSPQPKPLKTKASDLEQGLLPSLKIRCLTACGLSCYESFPHAMLVQAE